MSVNVKAADVCAILKRVMALGLDQRDELYRDLEPEYSQIIQNCIPITWIPLAAEASVIRLAAARLFPENDPASSYRLLGAEIAKINFRGIYRVFMFIPTLAFILKGMAQTWRTLCDQGEIRVENLTSNSADMVCSGLPELTPVHLEYIAGYDLGFLSLLRKNGRVTLDARDPLAWRWSLAWD